MAADHPSGSTGSFTRPEELLPRRIRTVDLEHDGALHALLGVLAEQFDLIEGDLDRLYENWFVETADTWAVPYLGDLVGYRMLGGYDEVLAGSGRPEVAALIARLAPRRDVAATVEARRRKGTLPVLEQLAARVADWPAAAREYRPLIVVHPPIRLFSSDPDDANARRHGTPGFLDVHDPAALSGLDGLGAPFEALPRTYQAPRVNGAERGPRGVVVGRQGRYRPPNVGVHVWRLRPYSLTRAPAYCIDRARNLYTFSILGNDVPLVAKPVVGTGERCGGLEGKGGTRPEDAPAFISRAELAERLPDLYGPDKSFAIWRDGSREPIPLENVVVTDLSGWYYRAKRSQVLVDPELGRIAFGARSAPRRGVWVTYHYAFSADIGGGEYHRGVVPPRAAKLYRVGPSGSDAEFERIGQAYDAWQTDNAEGGEPEAVIEIVDSGAYQEQLEFVLAPGDRLELRAAEGVRPVLRLLDWYSNRPDSLQVKGVAHRGDTEASAETGDPAEAVDPGETGEASGPAPVFEMNGLLVTGRGVSVTGPMGKVAFDHSTLVPGWSLEPHCEPTHPAEPSLVLENTDACVQVDRSIIGTILVMNDEVSADPISIHLADSILDATDSEREALSAPECRLAHAELSATRTTVIGEVHTHAVRIGQDSIFDGRMMVARRGIGCLRFCYVPRSTPAAPVRTPRRYQCQPDGVLAVLRDLVDAGEIDQADLPWFSTLEAAAIRPTFTSRQYGTPAYLQLHVTCAREITRGAEDHSEMGVFHDLFQPQRTDGLRARLSEFTPAGADAGIIFVT